MSIIDRILGHTPTSSPQITARAAGSPVISRPRAADVAPEAGLTPARDPVEGVISVYDPFGRKVEVGREAWRRTVLLPNLAANRDKPDELHDLLVSALRNGFAGDILESARHLADMDPEPQRGAVLLGAVLLQLRDFDRARQVLEQAIARHGETPRLVTNLARAYAGLGDEARALDLLWRALKADPNEESALHFLIGSANANGGTAAMLATYERVAKLPGSWRAQLWLARHALDLGDLEAATILYEEAIERAGEPTPADLLMQMSGDLGDRGQTEVLLRLTQPRFDLAAHGLMVADNLLRAYIDLGMLAEARGLLELLYSRQRPDWREHLIAWEGKLDDAAQRYGEIAAPLDTVLVKLEQPIWARGVLGFDGVLPAKAPGAPRVHFICGSGEAREGGGAKVVSQPTNDLGRLTRALPMFLAEELHLRTHARSAFLLPWMKQGGFIVSAKPWTRAFLPPDHVLPDMLVFLHVDAREAPWLLRITIENAQRDVTPVVFEQAFMLETAGQDVMALLNQLLPRLTILLALRREENAPSLATPRPERIPGYLAAIEQALAVGLASRQPDTGTFLHQERAIFDHLFEVALAGEGQWRPRMLLVNALEYEARRRPDIVREYLAKLALLQQAHPLPGGRGAELVDQGVATVRGKAGG